LLQARKKIYTTLDGVTTYPASYLCRGCIGVAVCKFIILLRLEPELGHLPVIAFTAAGRDKDRAATRLAGFQSTSGKTSFGAFYCKKGGLIGIVREVFEDEATNSCLVSIIWQSEKETMFFASF
jgi:hypothetical protein